MRRFESLTTAIGGQRMTDSNNQPMFDKKGRPIWHMPAPCRKVLHFKSAAAKAKLLAGKIGPEQAYKPVAHYRGIDAKTRKALKAQASWRGKEPGNVPGRFRRAKERAA